MLKCCVINTKSCFMFQIKLWDLPEGGLSENAASPICTFQGGERRVENVLFNPTASDILAASVSTTVKIYDLAQQQESIGTISF